MFDLVAFPPETWLGATQLFLALAVGHALADFPLQGEFLAKCKNRHALKALNDPERPPSIWVVCMLVHCLIHAGMVWWITGNFVFGLIELVVHFIIDVVKCEGYSSFNSDQMLHFLCKLAYVGMAFAGITFCCCCG